MEFWITFAFSVVVFTAFITVIGYLIATDRELGDHRQDGSK